MTKTKERPVSPATAKTKETQGATAQAEAVTAPESTSPGRRSRLDPATQEALASRVHVHYNSISPEFFDMETCREHVREGRYDSIHNLTFFLDIPHQEAARLFEGARP